MPSCGLAFVFGTPPPPPSPPSSLSPPPGARRRLQGGVAPPPPVAGGPTVVCGSCCTCSEPGCGNPEYPDCDTAGFGYGSPACGSQDSLCYSNGCQDSIEYQNSNMPACPKPPPSAPPPTSPPPTGSFVLPSTCSQSNMCADDGRIYSCDCCSRLKSCPSNPGLLQCACPLYSSPPPPLPSPPPPSPSPPSTTVIFNDVVDDGYELLCRDGAPF